MTMAFLSVKSHGKNLQIVHFSRDWGGGPGDGGVFTTFFLHVSCNVLYVGIPKVQPRNCLLVRSSTVQCSVVHRSAVQHSAV